MYTPHSESLAELKRIESICFQSNLEYERYLKEVVNALESDKVFRQKLDNATEIDVRVSTHQEIPVHVCDGEISLKLSVHFVINIINTSQTQFVIIEMEKKKIVCKSIISSQVKLLMNWSTWIIAFERNWTKSSDVKSNVSDTLQPKR